MGHPPDLGAHEMMWVSPQVSKESDENVGIVNEDVDERLSGPWCGTSWINKVG
jgi:hypothetical protein